MAKNTRKKPSKYQKYPRIYYKGESIPCNTKKTKERHKEIQALELFISKTKSEVLQRIAGERIQFLSSEIKKEYEYFLAEQTKFKRR